MGEAYDKFKIELNRIQLMFVNPGTWFYRNMA